jgi:hypothetical protein
MLKRFSSFMLALVIGSGVLAGTVRPSSEHVCKMAGMQMMGYGDPEMMNHRDMAMMDHGDMAMMDHGDMAMMDHGMQGMHHRVATMDHHDMETKQGMETMPCCKKHATQAISNESDPSGQCCVNIPHETGSNGTTFNLRRPSFSVAVVHPAIVQSPLAAPKPYECSHSTKVFLPNLQASYIRNLSILI